MAAALVGGAFLSSFVNVVFDRLSSPEVVNWIKGKKLDEKLLGKLKRILNVVRAVLNDAEQKQIIDPAVKDWLADLEDAVYNADDLLDEVATRAATQKDGGNIWTRYFNLQDREMVSKIEEVIETLEDIAKHKDILGLKEIANVNKSGRIQTTSLVDKSEIYGRGVDKENIIKLLLDDTCDARVSVIPIVGMGGIGKTTLAQLVYNDDKLEGKFDFKAWVCVGEEFDIVKVTKTIIAAVTSSSCDKDDLNLLQIDLKEKLSGNKFLIVLDDMWNDRLDEWNILRKPFQYGNMGSKILVTTRSDKVALVVKTIQTCRLDLLSEEDCWSMFVKHAYHSTESREYSALEQIGRKIVSKCKGLPLALETLCGLLQTNYDVNYWENIVKSELWKFPDDDKRIIPALKISYHYLPSHLKRCFVYCSLYPKDYEFNKDELILLWMAEEFLVRPNETKTLEEMGHEYFNELVARSFFHPSKTSKSLFVMHDLMHDLATLCAGEFYFRDEAENAIEIGKASIKTRHLSHNSSCMYPISKLLTACDRLKHTRTFLEVNLRSSYEFNMEDDPCILLSQLKCLRVLSFNSLPLDSLPPTIGELIHMRYLDLSNTPITTLPESLSSLYNLQTLKLKDCEKLEMLPSGMQDLVNLRHLDISGTTLQEMPKGMRKMKHLQFLSNYDVGKHEENNITELGALLNLHGKLTISNIENVVNGKEALEARMIDKKYINSLDLIWSPNSNVADSQIERDILGKLQPHPYLKQLSIYGYSGTIFPDWLGHFSYKYMTDLTLYGCENCCVLPPLGQLSSLNHLTISKFDSLISIGAEFYMCDESCQDTPFPSLVTLIFDRLEFWKEWHPCKFEDVFPQLKELTIQNCPKLIGELPRKLPKLEKLSIDDRFKQLACCLPRDPQMLEHLKVEFINELRMKELPLSLNSLEISGGHLVESVFKAISHIQPTHLQSLYISDSDLPISFPGDCLPASLQSLKIFNCKKLHFPTQEQQQQQSLQRLMLISSCDSLTSFPLKAFPNLRDLDIRFCENMESLMVSQSHERSNSCLRSLTIIGCPNFMSFPTLGMATPQLETLKIQDCPEIASFPFSQTNGTKGCLPPNLRELDIRGCEKLVNYLESIELTSQSLTSLTIDGASESVKSFPKEGWLPASLESLYLSHFPSLETLDCNGLSYINSLQSLSICDCEKLENMTGQRMPASLTSLFIYGSPLLAERCEIKDPQIWPKISHIDDIQACFE